MSDNFYSDVAKALIGTFAGAGLAFVSNWWFQHRSQIRDDLASGRRAVFTVRSQFDNFVNYRYAIRFGISRMYREIGDAQEWAYARPIAFKTTESNLLDFKSLAFLLSTQAGRGAFERLQFTERTYLDLIARLSDFNSSAQELQRTLAPYTREHPTTTLEAIETYLGPELTARVRDHQRACVLRFDRDEQRYRKALDMLNIAMSEMFGPRAAMSVPTVPDKYNQENLPPLPPALQVYLDSVPIAPD